METTKKQTVRIFTHIKGVNGNRYYNKRISLKPLNGGINDNFLFGYATGSEEYILPAGCFVSSPPVGAPGIYDKNNHCCTLMLKNNEPAIFLNGAVVLLVK